MTSHGADQVLSAEEFRRRSDFIVRLGLAAYENGIPVGRLDPYLREIAARLGLRAEFVSAPPLVTFLFSLPGGEQERHLTERLPAIVFDLGKVAAIGDLMNELSEGTVPFGEGEGRLAQIQRGPARFGVRPTVVGFFLIGFGLAALLTSGWWSSAVAGVLGVVTFIIFASLAPRSALSQVSEIAATFVVAVLAQVAAGLVSGLDPYVVILCGIVVLVPGLDMTIGVVDMASGNTLLGLSRFIRSVFITLKLFIGTIAGVGLVKILWPDPPQPLAVGEMPAPLPLIFFIVALVGVVMVFQVGRRDQAWVVGVCFAAFVVFVLGAAVGSWQGTFAAAVMVAATGAWYSLGLHRPATILLLPGFLLLVPGIAAYVGLVNLQVSGPAAGAAAVASVAVQMLSILMALVLVSSVTPRRPGL